MSSIKLTLSQLEQYLSKAAWTLKGPVDAAAEDVEGIRAFLNLSPVHSIH